MRPQPTALLQRATQAGLDVMQRVENDPDTTVVKRAPIDPRGEAP